MRVKRLLALALILILSAGLNPTLVKAVDNGAVTVGLGASSRVPVADFSIARSMFYDGANYIYITPYGNYTWLQPGNLLR